MTEVLATVDDTNPALRTLNPGNYGIFLIMGNAGFTSSTSPFLFRTFSFGDLETDPIPNLENSPHRA